MKKSIVFAIVSILSMNMLVASNGDPVVPSRAADILDVKSIEDFVIIDFLRSKDLDLKRPIYIYNAKGKRIFKSNAGKREKITELNMTQLKQGKYIIETVIGNHTIQIKYEKD